MEILLYGLEQGETRDYMETLLASNCRNDDDVQKVINHAKGFGFHSFKVATYNGEKPDFTKVFNK
jgi:hypothetical protein